MSQQSPAATERDLCRIRRAMVAHDERPRAARKRAWGEGYTHFASSVELARLCAKDRRRSSHFLPWLDIDAIVASRSTA